MKFEFLFLKQKDAVYFLLRFVDKTKGEMVQKVSFEQISF